MRWHKPEELGVSIVDTKSPEDYFRDWESHVFGHGYGSGDPHIIGALHRFFEAVPPDGLYDYVVLEAALGATVAWLLIDKLIRADAIEYGTSPRYAWLTKDGEALRAFITERTSQDLLEIVCADYDRHCMPDACNCGPTGYVVNQRCANPFWLPVLVSHDDTRIALICALRRIEESDDFDSAFVADTWKRIGV